MIIAQDNFDSYAVNTTINSKNGGSGWANAWQASGNNLIYIETAQFDSSPQSLRKAATTYGNCSRQLSTPTKDLVFKFKLRNSQTLAGVWEFLAVAGSSSFRFVVNGNTNTWALQINGVTQGTTGSFPASQWNDVQITANQTANTIKVSINGTETTFTFSTVDANFTEVYAVWPTTAAGSTHFDSIEIDNDLSGGGAVQNSAFLMFM